MKSLSFFATVLLSLVSVAAQSADFKRFTDYKCNGETVSVFDCRNDPGKGQPVHPLDNVCAVEFPDRPRGIATIPYFEHIVHADLARKLSSCTKPPSSDAAVAKAQAAKVDTVVFGIQLGDPFGVPACPMFQVGGSGPKTCYDQTSETIKDLAGEKRFPTDVKTVYLGANECPSWVNECTLHVRLYEGKVGTIGVFTKGPAVDKTVRAVLAEKYGQWKYSSGGTVTPGDPTKEKIKIMMSYWELPGLFIEYQPIASSDDGDAPSLRQGIIRVETETARKARTDAAAKALKPKM